MVSFIQLRYYCYYYTATVSTGDLNVDCVRINKSSARCQRTKLCLEHMMVFDMEPRGVGRNPNDVQNALLIDVIGAWLEITTRSSRMVRVRPEALTDRRQRTAVGPRSGARIMIACVRCGCAAAALQLVCVRVHDMLIT